MGDQVKIAVFADTHLGYSAYRATTSEGFNVRWMDGVRYLKTVVDQILAAMPDLVLIPGDLFHTPAPSVLTTKIAQEEIGRLAAVVPVIATAGNHETSAEINLKIPSTWLLKSIPGVITVADSIQRIPFHGVLITAVSHQAAFEYKKDLYSHVKPKAGEINLFTGHGTAYSHDDHLLLHTEESPREVVIPEDVVYSDDFAVVALGHIHSRKSLKGSHVFYAGSALRRGFSDKPGERGWTLLTIDENTGRLVGREDRVIPQRPQFDLPEINAGLLTAGQLEDLLINQLTTALGDGERPIVRQRVKNLKPGVRESFDRKEINTLAEQTLNYQLELSSETPIATAEKQNSFSDWLDAVGAVGEGVRVAKEFMTKAFEEKIDRE